MQTTNSRKPKSIAGRWSWLRRPALGIDIGTYTTKIALLDRRLGTDGTLALASVPTLICSRGTAERQTSHQTYPIPADLAALPKSKRPGQPNATWSQLQLRSLAERVAASLDAGFLGRLNVAISLSMSVCDFRSFSVSLNEHPTADLLQQRVQEATGDSRRRQIACIRSQGNSDKLRTLSIPADLSNSIATMFDEVKLTPDRIVGLPWAISAALQSCECPDEEILVALDWGFGRPTLVVMIDGQIDYVRQLSHGSLNRLVTPVCDRWGFSIDEGLRWLQLSLDGKQHPTEDASELLNTELAIVDACAEMAQEVNSAIEFIRWRHQGKSVQQLVLLGGGSQLHGLSHRLQRELIVPIEAWAPRCQPTDITADFAFAAGLASGGEVYA